MCCIMTISNSIEQTNLIGGVIMFMEERQQEIAEIIQTNGKITTAEITEKYGI